MLDAIEAIQGAPIPASELEREILPARVEGYTPADLDRLISAGEVVWVGVEPLGERDGRVTLFLTDHLHLLAAAQVLRRQPRPTSKPASSSTCARPAHRSSQRCMRQ